MIGRKPANFVPDDDMIVVPLNIERSVYEDFNEKHKHKFAASKKRMDFWLSQEQYAIDYGLEDASFIYRPSQEEKINFFKRNYLRFISKDIQRSNQQTLRQTWQSWTADDEIDAIEQQEKSEKYIVKAQGNSSPKVNKSVEARIKVGKKKFKFRIQPRVEQGMVKITLDTDYIDVKAWLGANGNQEIKISQRFSKTGTNALLYYYIDQTRVLASVDQRLYRGLNLRVTHEKDISNFDSFFMAGEAENNTMQLRFSMAF
jgi:hypothetical protein